MAIHDIEEVRRRLQLSADEVADIYVPFVEGREGRAATLAEVLADPLASYQQVFDTVWTSDEWGADDYDAALCYALRHADKAEDRLYALNRQTLISAVGTAVVRHYDARKMHFLFDVVDGIHAEENVRAVIFILLAEAQHPGVIYSDIYFRLRMEHFRASTPIWLVFYLVQACFIAVAASPELSSAYDEEMRTRAHEGLLRAKEMKGASNEEIMSMLDDDPKLQKFRDEMVSIIRRMIKLRCLGADVGYSTFAEAFGEISFFDEAANWFCPFCNDHPLLFNINNAQRFLYFMADSKSCNTDRFALLLSIPDGVPEVKIIKKDAETADEVSMEGDEAEEFLKHMAKGNDSLRQKRELPLNDVPRFLLFTLITECVHDTFRYYTLYLPKTSDAHNPFARDVAFWRLPQETPLFFRTMERRTFANWLFECRRYAEAAELYSSVLADFEVDIPQDDDAEYDLSDLTADEDAASEIGALIGIEEVAEDFGDDEQDEDGASETEESPQDIFADEADDADGDEAISASPKAADDEAAAPAPRAKEMTQDQRRAEIYSRLGQCFEHLDAPAEAADNYRKALCLAPDDVDTMQRLADYYRAAENWTEALPLLEALNAHLLSASSGAKRSGKALGRELRMARHLAEAYMHVDRYAEAIPLLSKVNYLCPTHLPTMRALALSYIVCCEYENAERQYRTLLADPRHTAEDLYAAGHSALLIDDIDLAVERYKASLAMKGLTHAAADFFGEDRPFLAVHGVDPVLFEYAIDLINI